MVRRITPHGDVDLVGGVLLIDEFETEEVGLADARLAFDEDVVDCSRRIFQITTAMMMAQKPMAVSVFPSRRWRNLRTGQQIDRVPDRDHPLLYLGNPIRLFADGGGSIRVSSTAEFLIKSGPELGF